MPVIIAKDKNRNDEEYFAYIPPAWDIVYEDYSTIMSIFIKYAKENHISPNEAMADEEMLGNIIVRVDQRCEYYKIFHENTYLDEIRKTAILAYWITKYRPFHIEMRDSAKWQNRIKINEVMALHLILGIISKIISTIPQTKQLSVSPEYRKKIFHAFKEHDISKESIMVIADSLLERAQ